ncbi:DinB family protein [Marinactinospora rubrisoli]|uniref:DinB family protein n=1 Tax=Marinactinospora rubrisoli TaxID=2715399 RepID=A0ABW2KIW0_9ACTN
MTDTGTITPTDERAELLSTLAEQRSALLITVRGIGDAESTRRTTASRLTLAGLLKHVAAVERSWTGVLTGRGWDSAADGGATDDFVPAEGETLAVLADRYAEVARETERAVAGLPGLDVGRPLPVRPWFPPGTVWSARRILLHLIRETAQHSGHADIIRESLDGATTTPRLLADIGGTLPE